MSNHLRIRPSGWMREFLCTQMSGLTGHIEEAGFPYDTVKWNSGSVSMNNGNPEWWVYEQVAYWIDGFTRCAILLEDKKAIKRAEKIIMDVLLSPDDDGYIGPKLIKEGENISRWPHVVFFRACMALYEYNNDTRITDALLAHFLNERDEHCTWRDMNNVEIMLWLYGKVGDPRLLEYAESTYRRYNARRGSDSIDEVSLSGRKPTEHGVSHNEYMKQGSILYAYTGKREYLNVSRSAFRKMEKFFMLPGGCICSNESMIDNRYYETYETCDVSDMTWSLGYLYSATGSSHYGDSIERCVFNAGLGSVTEDFRALQYFSGANQITLGYSSNHNDRGITTDWMRYAPNPGTECCPGNVNRFMPNYIFNMWQNKGDKLVSRLYGPSEVRAKVASGEVFIREKTSYPFGDKISFDIETEGSFVLSLRIPRFLKSMSVDGVKYTAESLKRRSFLNLEISENKTVEVAFDFEIEEKRSAPGVYLARGPLVFSFPVPERREAVKDKTSGENYPSYNIYPLGEWRYAILGDYRYSAGEVTDGLYSSSLPSITFSARRILNLSPDKRDGHYEKGRRSYTFGEYTFTPRLKPTSRLKLSPTEKTIKLIPYGMAKLRMTVFNKIK